MSLSNNFPTIRPSLLLDFANVGRLDPRVTFTRASTATYYDGVTTAVAEQNLLTYSQEFDNSSASGWAKTNVTISANTADTNAPDGTATAEKITDDATNGGHLFVENINSIITANTEYVLSVYLKAGTLDYGTLVLRDSASSQKYAGAVFDLDLGTVSQTFNGTDGVLVSSSISSAGNNWYRCVIVAKITTLGSSTRFAIGMASASTGNTISSTGAVTYAGSSSDIYAWGAQLEQRSSVTAYTATTTQAITNYVPVLLTAQNDVPRFDHNPTTGAALGLLIEEQRTNLLTYSEDFANAAWSNLNVTVTTNQSVAPDGTLSADLVVPNTTNAAHRIRQDASLTSGTSYSNSMYFKAAGYNWIYIQLSTGFDSVGSLYRNVNISDGTLGTGTLGANDVTVSSVGNGWYRVNITRTATSTTTGRFNWVIRDSDGATTSFAGDDYKGVFVWGAQLEAGAFATSYIPTTTTALTRNADVASITGTNFSSWFNASEFTVVSSFQRDTTANAASGGGSSVPRIYTFGTSAGGILQLRLFGSIGAEATGPSMYIASSWAAGQVVKHALAYAVNNAALVRDGGSAATDTSVDPFSTVPDMFSIGANTSGTGNIGQGWIQRLAYYPQRLSDAQLQALTG